jgi:hypothetical protein
MAEVSTKELITALKGWGLAYKARNSPEYNPLSEDLFAAAEIIEEQEKIINQYKKADSFLNAHGWKWENQ